jgi:hypothetical protein
MQEQENVMRVTIHATYLSPDEQGTPKWVLLLQKVARTIDQFEAKGWYVQDVNQDDAAATIVFHRCKQVDAETG